MNPLDTPLPLAGLDATAVDEAVLRRLAAFGDNWFGKVGNEQQLSQSFLNGLCEALGTPKPTDGTLPEADYQFERPVVVPGVEWGRIDLYKKGHFVLEAKCGRTREEPGRAPIRGTKRYRRYIENAFLDQARIYTARLDEGPPPLVIVVDVGWRFWIWRHDGAGYGGFHSPRRIEIPLDRVADEDYARILLACFEDPRSLDPSKEQERVTREAAKHLADLASALDARYDPDRVARFLMRCLFCMFAEDADLLAPNTFTALLQKALRAPEAFAPEVSGFFRIMDQGGSYDFEIIRRFNGALFHDAEALPLGAEEIRKLADAAALRWDLVEPSIFGTLLERALDPRERKRLGAHYTPRAYVERLVRATVEDPLRREWDVVQARVDEILSEEDVADGLRTQRAGRMLSDFIDRLARMRVLDPACGTGNFLYVSYAIVKGLEHEAREALRALGAGAQEGLALEGGRTVVPSHFMGLESKPWAAEIAQLVLWIGHLQWEIAHGRRSTISDPVLGEERSIGCRDALITWEATEPRVDEHGEPVLRWDRERTIPSPVTGQPIPDPDALVDDETYLGVAPAEWPEAEFIVGNPPFIGNKQMREYAGDGYVEAVRGAYPDVAETVDFVMYWWHRAAEAVRRGEARRFGFITTNSLRQTFNRQVTAHHLDADPPLGLAMAIADHPWVDETGSAAVRIAMTVGEAAAEGEDHPGLLGRVAFEGGAPEEVRVGWRKVERIHADLSYGADVSSAVPLEANANLSFQGMNLVGKGFRVTDEDIRTMGFDPDDLPPVIRPYLNASELMRKRQHRKVIDAYGYTAEELADAYPTVHQWLFDYVKPHRDQNRRKGYREKWWMFGEARGKLRRALEGLERYIAVPRVARQRTAVLMPVNVVPDCKLVAIAVDDGLVFGVMCSRAHTLWTIAAGGRLGVGNDVSYDNVRCFGAFPFPEPSPELRARIAELGEELDAYRKAVQARHPSVTLTGIYNVLEKIRAGEELTPKERETHARVATNRLRALHDALDRAVFEAYGWESDLDDAELLTRLVALNRERAAEEGAGRVRWLRPPEGAAPTPVELLPRGTTAKVVGKAARTPWPSDPTEQMLAVLEVLDAATGPLSVEDVAATFHRANRRRLRHILDRLTDRRLATADDQDRYGRAGLQQAA
ncbi:MAG: class I SAM-dependent DNA methyltransferase [Myxococcota bacterium]